MTKQTKQTRIEQVDISSVSIAKSFATILNSLEREQDGFIDQGFINEFAQLMDCLGARLDSPESHSRGAIDPNRYWVFKDGSKLDLANPEQAVYSAHATASVERDLELFDNPNYQD